MSTSSSRLSQMIIYSKESIIEAEEYSSSNEGKYFLDLMKTKNPEKYENIMLIKKAKMEDSLMNKVIILSFTSLKLLEI